MEFLEKFFVLSYALNFVVHRAFLLKELTTFIELVVGCNYRPQTVWQAVADKVVDAQ